MKVYINTPDKQGRKLVEVKLIEERKTAVVVELPDGNRIVRKKKRDLPKKEEDKS
ncbi:MAG: hypothetical protein ACTSPD_10275 [Promethearchaeota archaeon]